jgi:non-specific serine/threonine protein kinase/serine/threonine-protein kinase
MSEPDGTANKPDSDLAAGQLDSRSPASSEPEVTLDRCTLGPVFSAAGAVSAKEPKFIGPYRLVRRLGEGGMGQVWLAEQTAPIHRQVALKLIKVGRYDDSVLQRFYAERQSLAIMDHPSIAKVFDAGATPDGQPYFVMEYVPGQPITEYCDRQRLKIRERLELFVKVCEGVQHAHQKAVMHRDLKPANIMVVKVDGKPVPRIIDFGLAKPASLQLDGETLVTEAGGWVGTPGYMSPEQADPSVIDVDTRTDVYSLGAVLYVLLTGFLPFETNDWRKQRIDEFLRCLREEDPPRPSTKVDMGKQLSQTAAEARGTEPTHLAGLLHGDLDWITLKALEKDRARRYGTPMELAADIERYLAHQPVIARPASASYRLRKYARRHRIGVSVAVGLVLLLAGFAVMQSIQMRRITRERDRANRITNFMEGMFKVSNPTQARGNSITAREVLDKASKEIETGLTNDPETQAELMGVMGVVYHDLGLYSPAEQLLRHAVEVDRRTLGVRNRETLTRMSSLATFLSDAGHDAESEELHRETLQIQRQVLGPNDPDSLLSMRELSMTLTNQGRFGEAEKLQQEELEIARRVLGPEHPSTIKTRMYLASTLNNQGRYAEAESMEREVLDARRRLLGADHPDTLRTMMQLAATVEQEGRYTEAEKLGGDVLEMERRVMGPESPDVLGTMANLSGTLLYEGRYAEAEKLGRETIALQHRVLGREHPDTLRMMGIVLGTLIEQGRYGDAEKLGRETLDLDRRVFGSDHPETAVTTYNLGALAARQGQKDRALSLLSKAVDHGLIPPIQLNMGQDPDLGSLHGDPQFTTLVAHAKEVAQSKDSGGQTK